MRFLMTVSVIFLLLTGCEKEMSITEFSDDFDSYEVELRIEAVLNPHDFSNSVIRVDRTMLVTDTSLFNGIDDNGDWTAYSDTNGNGQWDEGEPLNDDIGVAVQGPSDTFEGRGNGIPDPGEPHIDDYAEILPQIHDSTLTSVLLLDEQMNTVAEFEWVTEAAEFDESYGNTHGPMGDNSFIYTYTYGGYKPKPEYSDISIGYNKEYQFRLTTAVGDVITGSTVPLAPAENFNAEFSEMDDDTLALTQYSTDGITWTTDPNCFILSAKVEKIIAPDSLINEFNVFLSTNEVNADGEAIYKLPLFFLSEGLYQLTVNVFDEHYGNYFISELPLRDEALSNLRDQNDVVVLGIAGSVTESNLIFRIEY